MENNSSAAKRPAPMAEIAGPRVFRWVVPCRSVVAPPPAVLAGPAVLAPVLRRHLADHRPQRGTMLKTNDIFRRLACTPTNVPAEIAGPRVSLCRAES